MNTVKWAEPALLWDDRHIDEMVEPKILELKTDDFLPNFLSKMQARPDPQLQRNVEAVNFLNANKLHCGPEVTKLFQPLHSRYYLVTGSLICEQFGLPDKFVDLKEGERTFFVIRRLQNGAELGWSETCGWNTITDPGNSLRENEELFPLHPVSVCTGKSIRLERCERKIYYGYVATGNRGKYIDSVNSTETTNSNVADTIRRFFEGANQVDGQDLPENLQFSPLFAQFDTRVVTSWKDLSRNSNQARSAPALYGLAGNALEEGSLIILLNCLDVFARAIPTIFQLLSAADEYDGDDLPQYTQNLYTFLKDDIDVKYNQASIPLKKALNILKPYVGLIQGQNINPPSAQFDVSEATEAIINCLKNKFEAATREEPDSELFTNAADADELLDLIENQVKPVPPSTQLQDDTYVLRLVYIFDPDCPPVLSEPTPPFTFARFFDADAPARMVHIEMPSIKLPDLRKFKHGVGIQMSPELRRVMDGIHAGMLNREDLHGAPNWSLGMVCTFSIQIITLIALVVMFIFAYSLNIVFWWLAFLKVCLPIPTKG